MYSDKKILITISGYYERFQIKTIESCIKRAKYPDRLTFAIAYHEDHVIDTSHIKNKIFKHVIPRGYKTGIQKAKNILFSSLMDEDFILSIDSHVIMMPDWDEELLLDYYDRLDSTENKNIVISGNFGNTNPIGGLDYNLCLEEYFDNENFFNQKNKNYIVDFITDGSYDAVPKSEAYYELMINTVPYLDHVYKDEHRYMLDREHTNIYSGNFSFFPRSWVDSGWNISRQIFFSGDQPETALNIFTSGYDMWKPRWQYHIHMSDHPEIVETQSFMLGEEPYAANRYFDIRADMSGINWFLEVINDGYPGGPRPRSVKEFFDFFNLQISNYPKDKLELYNLIYSEVR